MNIFLKNNSEIKFKALFILLAILLWLNPHSSYSQDKSTDPVEVSGHIVDPDNKKIKDTRIVIYNENSFVKEIESKRGKFEFTLQPGHYYTIEMKKKGFLTKRIGISTYIPPKTYVVEPFMFAMEMIPEEGVEEDFMFDFPVALVKFYKGKGRFDFITEYTKSIKAEREMALGK